MSKVNVKELKEAVDTLLTLQKKYNENGENMFHEISSIDDAWYGVDRDKFVDSMSDEKKKNELFMNNFDQICKCFKKIADSYDNIGGDASNE